jgi:hypothetical protein
VELQLQLAAVLVVLITALLMEHQEALVVVVGLAMVLRP